RSGGRLLSGHSARAARFSGVSLRRSESRAGPSGRQREDRMGVRPPPLSFRRLPPLAAPWSLGHGLSQGGPAARARRAPPHPHPYALGGAGGGPRPRRRRNFLLALGLCRRSGAVESDGSPMQENSRVSHPRRLPDGRRLPRNPGVGGLHG